MKVKFQLSAGKTEVVPPINAKIYVRGSRNTIFIFITSVVLVIYIIVVSELDGALLKESREYACRDYGPKCFTNAFSPSRHVFCFFILIVSTCLIASFILGFLPLIVLHLFFELISFFFVSRFK